MATTHPNTERVRDAARAAGLTIEVREFPEGTRTADDAARAIGCTVDQIVKSLVFLVDDEPVIALVSGAHRLDEAALLAAHGATEIARADADTVRSATGYPIGGVPPFGHPSPLPTYMDPHLLTFDVVWAAAGTPRHVFAVDPADLRAATRAEAADICR